MKKIFALVLCLSVLFSLVACGGGEVPSDGSDASVDASSESSTDTSTDTSGWTGLPEDTVDNWVIANDQIKDRVVVYDLDAYEEGDVLEDLEVWSVSTQGQAAGVKYREDTVFGDVVIVAGSHSAIYEYPSGKELWSTNNPGNNTHSIEILPSGNIVLANSTGNSLRMFQSSAILDGDSKKSQSFKDYELAGAHGVLWDPEYDVLWALGNGEIAAYALANSSAGEVLSKVSGMGTTFSGLKGSGHDLQPDYSDTRYLYFTAGNVYMFDKEENKVRTSFPYASTFQLPEIKGFSNNPNKKFFSTGLLGGEGKFFEGHWKESWLTDTIIFYFRIEKRGQVAMRKVEIVAEESAFYKVRAFYGQYQ